MILQLERNFTRALSLADARFTANLRVNALQVLGRLYQALLEPLRHRLLGRSRVYIVPHGPLHFLPFNLLYDGRQHLIDSIEVVTLPTSGLLTRHAGRASHGALAM